MQLCRTQIRGSGLRLPLVPRTPGAAPRCGDHVSGGAALRWASPRWGVGGGGAGCMECMEWATSAAAACALHAACSLQHAPCGMQDAPCGMRRAEWPQPPCVRLHGVSPTASRPRRSTLRLSTPRRPHPQSLSAAGGAPPATPARMATAAMQRARTGSIPRQSPLLSRVSCTGAPGGVCVGGMNHVPGPEGSGDGRQSTRRVGGGRP